MAISDEDRARVGELTMQGFDAMDDFGDDVRLEDAVVLFEVSYPDPGNEGERLCEIVSRTTTHRATVAGGMAQSYANTQTNAFVDGRDLEDED